MGLKGIWWDECWSGEGWRVVLILFFVLVDLRGFWRVVGLVERN